MVFSRRNEKFAKHVTLCIALTNTKLYKEEIARLVTFHEILLFTFDIPENMGMQSIEINLIERIR